MLRFFYLHLIYKWYNRWIDLLETPFSRGQPAILTTMHLTINLLCLLVLTFHLDLAMVSITFLLITLGGWDLFKRVQCYRRFRQMLPTVIEHTLWLSVCHSLWSVMYNTKCCKLYSLHIYLQRSKCFISLNTPLVTWEMYISIPGGTERWDCYTLRTVHRSQCIL